MNLILSMAMRVATSRCVHTKNMALLEAYDMQLGTRHIPVAALIERA